MVIREKRFSLESAIGGAIVGSAIAMTLQSNVAMAFIVGILAGWLGFHVELGILDLRVLNTQRFANKDELRRQCWLFGTIASIWGLGVCLCVFTWNVTGLAVICLGSILWGSMSGVLYHRNVRCEVAPVAVHVRKRLLV